MQRLTFVALLLVGLGYVETAAPQDPSTWKDCWDCAVKPGILVQLVACCRSGATLDCDKLKDNGYNIIDMNLANCRLGGEVTTCIGQKCASGGGEGGGAPRWIPLPGDGDPCNNGGFGFCPAECARCY